MRYCEQDQCDNKLSYNNKCGFCKEHNSTIRMQKWRNQNRNKAYKYSKQYWKRNRNRLQLARSIKHRERYKTDLDYRMKDVLRSRLNKAVRGIFKSGSAIRDLGCSITELREYLECKFIEHMSWENYGKWHIDHIKPLSSFDLSDPKQLKMACHYTNLQPLWARDNLKKGNKID